MVQPADGIPFAEISVCSKLLSLHSQPSYMTFAVPSILVCRVSAVV